MSGKHVSEKYVCVYLFIFKVTSIDTGCRVSEASSGLEWFGVVQGRECVSTSFVEKRFKYLGIHLSEVWNSMWLFKGIFPALWNHQYCLILEYFPYPQGSWCFNSRYNDILYISL